MDWIRDNGGLVESGRREALSAIRWLVKVLTSRHYIVRGDSMAPTLRNGDVVLVTGLRRAKAGPGRGDVVVVGEAPPGERRSIKRVVGMPGETVRTDEGTLYVGGVPPAEPYLGGLPAVLGVDTEQWALGPDEYLVLGDNRARSTDSRAYGPVERPRIIGRAWWRYWPPGRAGRL
ncbi:MAG: signal peptidase I [SAR202 cluster bacterium]|nr:signal peptidase I [SAR202 cluster bacterium]